MPNIDSSVGQRRARAGIDERNAQFQGHSGLSFGDVGAEFTVIDVVGSDLLLGGQTTSRGIGDSSGSNECGCRADAKSAARDRENSRTAGAHTSIIWPERGTAA
jgi:hypothetical protein